MGERESELERDRFGEFDDVGTDPLESGGLGSTRESDRSATRERGLRGRFRARVDSIFSASGLGAALVLVVVGMFAFGLVPLLGILGDFLGIAAGAFVYGLLAGRSRYIESVLAGALVAGGSVLLSYLFFTLLGTGTTLLAGALVGGAIAGGVGHYFGRDLREGLTGDIPR